MAELSELALGSRWFDPGDPVGSPYVVLEVIGERVTAAFRNSDDRSGWSSLRDLVSIWKQWTPYAEPPAKCPDFERYVGLDEDREYCGDIDTWIPGLIHDDFVFRIGVRNGEPFIEQVKP